MHAGSRHEDANRERPLFAVPSCGPYPTLQGLASNGRLPGIPAGGRCVRGVGHVDTGRGLMRALICVQPGGPTFTLIIDEKSQRHCGRPSRTLRQGRELDPARAGYLLGRQSPFAPGPLRQRWLRRPQLHGRQKDKARPRSARTARAPLGVDPTLRAGRAPPTRSRSRSRGDGVRS